QQVVNVILPDQSALDGKRSNRSCSSKRGPGQGEVYSFRFQIGLLLKGIAPDRHRTGCADCGSIGIVQIDQGEFPGLLSSGQSSKQSRLRRKVLIHRMMKIEMILREVREDRHVILAARGPV